MEMRIEQVLVGPPHEGDAGEGLVLRTSRGDIPAIRHAAPESTRAVVWVCGARGGFGGPASGLYAELSEEFTGQGITSLRMDYRQPNNIQECALDLLAGVNFLRATGYGPAVVVGHSFGGAVVIAGAAFSEPRRRCGVAVAADLRRAGRGDAVADAAPGGTRQGGHPAALLLRGSDTRLGERAAGTGALRWRGASPGRMPGRADGPAAGMDTGQADGQRRRVG